MPAGGVEVSVHSRGLAVRPDELSCGPCCGSDLGTFGISQVATLCLGAMGHCVAVVEGVRAL
eukprot:1072794-Lingulodinium_polyedra.AAC.1